jgi:hypothetical protein
MRQRTFRVTLSGSELSRLKTAANKRGLPPDVLFEQLVIYMIRDGLIDAVMDDRDTQPVAGQSLNHTDLSESR